MSQGPSTRSVQPHPPRGIPRYFAASPFDGAAVVPEGRTPSRRLGLYQALAAGHFGALPADLSQDDLDWLDRHLALRLEIEREERRMHFAAYALVCVLFFLTFVPQALAGFPNPLLGLLTLLLLALVLPYTFVYFGYENRVRAMALGRLRLAEALSSAQEPPGGGPVRAP